MKQIIILVVVLALIHACSSKFSSKNIMNDIGHNLPYGQVLVDQLDRSLSYKRPSARDSTSKFGFIDINGNVVIEPLFVKCTDFYGDYANVIQDSIYGYVSKAGEIKLFPEYDEVCWYYSDIGYAKLGEKYSLINRDGEQLTKLEFDRILLSNNNYFKVKTQGHWRIINEKGEYLFDSEIQFDHSLIYKGYTTYIKKINNRENIGLVSLSGNVIIEAKYDKLSAYFTNGLLRVTKGRKMGFINKSGVEVIPIEYDEVGDEFTEGLVPARMSNKWGFINVTNQIEIEFIYDDVKPFSEGLAMVKKDDKIGYIDKDHNIVIPIELPYIWTWSGNFAQGMAVFKNDQKKYGYIDRKGNVAIEPIYDSALNFENDMAYVKLNNKIGFISKTGEPTINVVYLKLWKPRNGLLRYVK